MNKPPKIVHASIAHSSSDDRILYRECLSLKKIYSNISIIGVGDKAKTTIFKDIKLISIKQSRLRNMRKVVWGILQKLDPTIVHIHDPYLLPLVPSLVNMGIKIIYDSHENWVTMNFQLSPQCFIKRLGASLVIWLWEKYYLSKLSGVVVVRPDLAEKFRKHQKIVELRNYPITNNHQTKNEKLISEIKNIIDGSLNIMYVGQISRKREIELAVETVKELNTNGIPAKFVTIGSIEKSDESYFHTLFEQNKKDVYYYSEIPHSEISSLLEIADIGWSVLAELPVFKMTFPNKNFEYLQAGLPFLSSNLYYVNQIIQETGAGVIVEKLEAKFIAKKISRLIKSNHLELLGKNGQHWFNKKYNWASQEKLLFEFYKRVLSE
jgi:glycosyltransferase involved in cell wall biosynthesis